MRALTVLHAYPQWLSQTQTWMHSQVVELQRLGIDAHVVCEVTDNLDQFEVPNLHCLRSENIAVQLWYRGLRKLRVTDKQGYLIAIGRKTGASIVHSHFGDIGWGNLTAVRKLSARHVVTFYGYDVNKLPTQNSVWRRRYRELFDEGDLFLCEGSHMARCIIELGAPEHKVKVQHLGVDLARFRFQPREWCAGQPLKVLIAASFREKKGIPYAVKALGVLHKEVPVELTIIGEAGADAASQQEKAKILDAIENAGIAGNTRLLGYQPYSVMLCEAHAHHLFLQPSVGASDGDTEGGAPVSIIEMLATGMPVVSTWHCDIPEVMGSALHHLLAPERDVDALAQIIRILIAYPARWARISAAGQKRVAAEYDLKVQARRLADHYNSLV